MGGSFACPECGNELALKGTTAGRRVRCGWCETWVEIPFLPRRVVRRARLSRGRRPRWVLWAWGGVAALTFLVVLFGGGRLLRMRGRQRVEQSLNALIVTAETEENAGRFDTAVEAIHAALKQAGRLNPAQPERLAEVRRLRDEVVRHAAEAQLENAARATPAEAIATYKALLSRIWRDGALEELEGTLRERLDRTRRHWAGLDLEAAKRAAAAGQPNEAIDLCERLVKTAEELAPGAQNPFQGEASSIVTTLIEQRGVMYDQPQGQFTLGTPQSYRMLTERLLGLVIRQHGYVPSRPGSTWSELWPSRAPYHVAVDVVERQQGSYLDTGNRPSILSAQIVLKHKGLSIWQVGPLQAQTQPSIPSLSAFTSSRLAIDESRRVEFERLLYDDAQTMLVEKLNFSLRNFPSYRAIGP